MSEKETAVLIANKALNVPHADPDDDLRTVSRQFLRSLEQITIYEEQWQPSKQEQIDELSDKFDALDDEYQELVKFSTMIFRGIPRFELTALMSSDEFEKFKNHIGV